MIQRWYWHKKSDGRVLEVADDLGGWVRHNDHVAALAAAREKYASEGIKLVEQQAKQVYRTGPDDVEAEVAASWIEWACSIARDDALAAFKAEAKEQDDAV